MREKVILEERQHLGVPVNTPVVFLGTSSGHTRLQFGVYRGFYKDYPVVEVETHERKWYWNPVKKTFCPEKTLSKVRRRHFLKYGRIYSLDRIQNLLEIYASFE